MQAFNSTLFKKFLTIKNMDMVIGHVAASSILTFSVIQCINNDGITRNDIATAPFSSLFYAGFGVGGRMFIYTIGYGIVLGIFPFRITNIVGIGFMGYANYVQFLKMNK